MKQVVCIQHWVWCRVDAGEADVIITVTALLIPSSLFTSESLGLSAPLGKTRSPGEATYSLTHTAPRARLLPSAAQPPTSKTTRRPTGPITDVMPVPQAGAMFGSDLQPPTSSLEGGWPQSLTERP